MHRPLVENEIVPCALWQRPWIAFNCTGGESDIIPYEHVCKFFPVCTWAPAHALQIPKVCRESIRVFCLSMSGYPNSLSAKCAGFFFFFFFFFLLLYRRNRPTSNVLLGDNNLWENDVTQRGRKEGGRTDRGATRAAETQHITSCSQIEVAAAHWGRLCNRSARCQIGEARF